MYWGSWKGRVVWAIAIGGARTWKEIRNITRLSPESLNKTLRELFRDKTIEKTSRGEYKVNPNLHRAYQLFSRRDQGATRPISPRLSKSERREFNKWIDKWRENGGLEFSLKPQHFFLEGRFLDEFLKKIIAGARKEVLVVNPYVKRCDLSNTLREAARSGTSVTLITRRPNEADYQYEDVEKYHRSLVNARVHLVYNSTTHAKIVVVDRTVAVVSSMNFYAKSSGGASWEAGLVTVDDHVVQDTVSAIYRLVRQDESTQSHSF